MISWWEISFQTYYPYFFHLWLFDVFPAWFHRQMGARQRGKRIGTLSQRLWILGKELAAPWVKFGIMRAFHSHRRISSKYGWYVASMWLMYCKWWFIIADHEVSINGGTPIAGLFHGWFISWEMPESTVYQQFPNGGFLSHRGTPSYHPVST